MKRGWFLLIAVIFLAVSGCSHADQGPTPDRIRQDTAKATRTAAQDAKAAVQGVVDGLKKRGPFNFNKSSVDDLETLPGIDAAHAQKMIDSRPYQSSDELVKRHVIPRIAYDRIAGEITAQ